MSKLLQKPLHQSYKAQKNSPIFSIVTLMNESYFVDGPLPESDLRFRFLSGSGFPTTNVLPNCSRSNILPATYKPNSLLRICSFVILEGSESGGGAKSRSPSGRTITSQCLWGNFYFISKICQFSKPISESSRS